MSQYPGGQPPQDPYYGPGGGDPYAPPPPQQPSDPYFGQPPADQYAPPQDPYYAPPPEAYSQQAQQQTQQQAWYGQQPGYYWPPQPRTTQGGERSGVGAAIVGIFLVALGAWFLFRDEVALDFGRAWPILAVGLGVLMVLAAFIPRRGS